METDIDTRVQLIKEVGEEIIGEAELLERLQSGERLVAYDGFEPSGKIHIAQGILRAINVNKLTRAGVSFKFWVADWFAMMNNKLDGNLEKIKITGKYFIEVWKACGMDMEHVEFLWASDVMHDTDYWLKVLTIGRLNSVARITRCAQIMGRNESDSLSAAQIFYPCMQCADIFHLKADIAQLGLDQRKVNVLAREVAPKLGYRKPIVVSHHMLMGLGEPAQGLSGVEAAVAKKMSKSNPDSAIFMTDTTAEVARKMKKAYCPEGVVQDNPVLEYCKYLLFERFAELTVTRPEKYGGSVTYTSYADLEADFVAKNLHPMDLKQMVSVYVDKLLQPVRSHFENDEAARQLKEQVERFQVTR